MTRSLTLRRVLPLLLAPLASACAGAENGASSDQITSASQTGSSTDATDTDATSDPSDGTTAGTTGTSTGSSTDPGTTDATTTDPTTDTGSGPGAGLSPVALAVDLVGDGVLDPGETVVAIPTWQNPHPEPRAPAGLAHDITGPPGPRYNLVVDAATYELAASESAACTSCYQLMVSGARPDVHWDLSFQETLEGGDPVTWGVHVGGSFGDVSNTDPHYPAIEALLHHDITTGCADGLFCPTDALTRAQAAVLLAAALAGGNTNVPASGTVPDLGSYQCGPGGVSVFDDVAADTFACSAIHHIAA